jgi:hypothetical protein
MPVTIVLEGARFNRQISESDITKIGSTSNRNDFGSIWGKIADWFCGTNKEGAKRELFNLMHPESNDQAIQSFNQLKDMASPTHKEYFTYTSSNNDDGSFNVKLTIEDILETKELKTVGVIDDVTERVKLSLYSSMNRGDENLKQIKMDISRFTYTCGENIYRDGSLSNEDLDIFTSDMSQEQKKSLDVIASQTGMIAIKNGIHNIGDGRSFVGTPELQEISMSKNIDGGVQVELIIKQNHKKDRFDIYKQSIPDAQYPCLSMKATLQVNTDGIYSFNSVNVAHPKIT